MRQDGFVWIALSRISWCASGTTQSGTPIGDAQDSKKLILSCVLMLIVPFTEVWIRFLVIFRFRDMGRHTRRIYKLGSRVMEAQGSNDPIHLVNPKWPYTNVRAHLCDAMFDRSH